MKIVFFDENEHSKEFETEAQDLKLLFKITEKLSDSEFKKLEFAIYKFPPRDEKQGQKV